MALIPLTGKPFSRPHVWQLYCRRSRAGSSAHPSPGGRKPRDTAPANNKRRNQRCFSRQLNPFISIVYIGSNLRKLFPYFCEILPALAGTRTAGFAVVHPEQPVNGPCRLVLGRMLDVAWPQAAWLLRSEMPNSAMPDRWMSPYPANPEARCARNFCQVIAK